MHSMKNFVKGLCLRGFLLYLIFTAACAGKEDQVIIHRNAQFTPNHSLIYQVTLGLKEQGDVFIEYYDPAEGNRHFSALYHVDQEESIFLTGLKARTEYHYIIHARIRGNTYKSRTYTFITEELPNGLPVLTLEKNNFTFDGYILLKTFYNPGAFVLVDKNADIVWYHLYDRTTVRAFNFTQDQTILSLVDSSEIEYIGLNGALVRQFSTQSAGIDKIHHDITGNSKGQTVVLTYHENILDLSGVGGQKSDTILGDGIVVFDDIGQKAWEWNIFDHADPLRDDSILYLKSDWSHGNSISFDPEGNYLLSLRNLNQVWKIDHQSGEVLWRFGINGDIKPATPEAIFIHQHDVHINRFGDLMMFDNGLHQRGFSRIISFKMDEDKTLWEPVLNLELDQEHTTFRMGSARFIDDQHLLVSSPKRHMKLSIINTKGDIVWSVKSDKSSYRAIYLEREVLDNKRWFK